MTKSNLVLVPGLLCTADMWSEQMAAGIPGAKHVVIENSGHMSTIEQPGAVSALMRYWLL